MTQTETKTTVRQKSLRKRDALSEKERVCYSQEIWQRFTSLSCYQEAEVLLAYENYRSEVITSGLIHQALSEGRQVWAPKVTGQDMDFYQITGLADLHTGYRGIMEPAEGVSFTACLKEADTMPRTLLCMPGAAFDRARHRIGYGGGFYDRYLATITAMMPQRSLPLTTAALAYGCQVFDEIPWEPHDVAPDILLTEQEVIL